MIGTIRVKCYLRENLAIQLQLSQLNWVLECTQLFWQWWISKLISFCWAMFPHRLRACSSPLLAGISHSPWDTQHGPAPTELHCLLRCLPVERDTPPSTRPLVTPQHSPISWVSCTQQQHETGGWLTVQHYSKWQGIAALSSPLRWRWLVKFSDKKIITVSSRNSPSETFGIAKG